MMNDELGSEKEQVAQRIGEIEQEISGLYSLEDEEEAERKAHELFNEKHKLTRKLYDTSNSSYDYLSTRMNH